METSETALMQVLFDEHGAALWRYAMRLTGDRARAEDVVQETLLRAWQHPEVVDDTERSARAWLFTVARNMIIDERRSARFRNEVGSPDERSSRRHRAQRGRLGAGPAADRRCDGPTVCRSPCGDSPLVLPRMVNCPDCGRPRHRRGHREVQAALRDSCAAPDPAGDGGDAMSQPGQARPSAASRRRQRGP